jgi:hypothetical protein
MTLVAILCNGADHDGGIHIEVWYHSCSELGIRTVSCPIKSKQTRSSWNEKSMFLLTSLFVANDWKSDICINTFTIYRLVRYILLAQLFSKTKVKANLQFEADRNLYAVLWICRSLYCVIHSLFLQINYMLVPELSLPSISKCNVCIFYKTFIEKRCLFSKNKIICTNWCLAVENNIWYNAAIKLCAKYIRSVQQQFLIANFYS